jgi:hypothetical protein
LKREVINCRPRKLMQRTRRESNPQPMDPKSYDEQK